MSCNRFYVLYFPFGIKSIVKVPTANIYIFFALLCVTLLTFFIFSKGCGYVFYPEYFQLIQEDSECTDNLMKQTMYFIFGFTVVGISQRDTTKRRRKWMVLFVQSVLQDCLHLIDIINAYFMWKLSEELWFQFYFLTLSFILIYTLDGFVMLAFNKDVRPKCCQCSKVPVGPTDQRRSTLTTITSSVLKMKVLLLILVLLALTAPILSRTARWPCTDNDDCWRYDDVCWYDNLCYNIDEIIDEKAPPLPSW
ncbi:unnamed protein product [Caenorhabditis brenneri]